MAEEARQPLRRDGDGDGRRVDARTARLQRRIAQVRGKDLDLGRIVQGIGILQQQDGERVGFLAGGTARRPHPHLVAAAFPGKEARNDGVGQGGPRLGVAEEFGDVNEQVMKERLDLGRILAQRRQIGAQRGGVGELHAAGDTAQERRALVAGKIVAGTRAHQGQDLRQRVLLRRWPVGACQHGAQHNMDALGRHQLRRQRRHRRHHVGDAGGNRALRHAGEFGFFRRLDKHQAARLLDRLDAYGAVAA